MFATQRAKAGTPKRNTPNLADWFEESFGPDEESLRSARQRFVHSLAAYAVVCYIMQVRTFLAAPDGVCCIMQVRAL